MAPSEHVILSRGLTILRTVERLLVVVAFAVLALALFSDVVGREVVGQGIYGAVTLAVYALIYVTTFGMSEATSANKHLRPTVFDRVLGGLPETAFARVSHVISAVIFVGLAVSGAMFVSESFTYGDRSDALGWLIWPIQAAIPLGFALCALKHLLFTVDPALQDARTEEMPE